MDYHYKQRDSIHMIIYCFMPKACCVYDMHNYMEIILSCLGFPWIKKFAQPASISQKLVSSFIFTYQIPRASGQSRAMPAHVRRGDTGLSNRKWSYCKYREQKFYTQSANNGYGWSSENLVLSRGGRNEGVRLENSIIWSIFLIVGGRKMQWQARPKPISDYMWWKTCSKL